jgi:ubiquinone/menaquinone biosynthesis C-methylase UbiE
MTNLKIDTTILAKKYDEISDAQFENGKILIEKLGVKNGHKVLDIGCGTGRLGLYAADKIGPTGWFVGIDPLENRINIAKKKNRNPIAVFKTGVSDDLSFLSDDTFDIVYLNAVFHWIVNKDATLAEIHRILKPGGKLGITTAAKELPGNFKLTIDSVLLREPYAGYVVIDDDPMFRYGVTTSELKKLLSKAGFKNISSEVRKVIRHYATPQDALALLEASSFGNFLLHVPESLREKARTDILAEFENQRADKGIESVGNSNFTTAQKG